MCNPLKWLMPALAAAALFCWSYTATSRADDAAATGSVTGTVVDSNNKGVANMKVRLFNPKDLPKHGGGGGGAAPAPNAAPGGGGGAGAHPAPVAEATTDKDGKFTMDKVPVGDYVCAANDRTSGQHGMAKVSVTAGNAATVSITLQAGAPGGGKGGHGGGGGAAPAPGDGGNN
jgi:hypothetical protein